MCSLQGGEESSPLEVKSNGEKMDEVSPPNKNQILTEKSSQDEISHEDEGDTRLPLVANEVSADEESGPPLISKTNVSFI